MNRHASMHIKLMHLFCSVLDLNAFERQNKAEGLGMVSEEGTSKSQSSLFDDYFLRQQVLRYLGQNITAQPLF